MNPEPPYPQIATALVAWFESVARPLPWRQGYHPYQVWVSEIMAQQTRMETVVPYFKRFMEALPDLASLAAVDEDRLIKLWEGLGYYSRARNLKKAAQQITELHQGQVPQNRTDLEALAGIGPYTAGAILAIAFNQPEPLVDGNIERVLSRLLDLKDNVKSAPGRAVLVRTVTQILLSGEPRQLAQGMMELGAMFCSPKNPNCTSCPLSAFCLALSRGTCAERPVLPERKKAIKQQKTIFIFEHQGHLYLEQQPAGALWTKMLLFPMLENPVGSENAAELAFDHHQVTTNPTKLGGFRYSVTCYQVQAEVWLAPLDHRPDWPGQWETPAALQAQGLPRPALKSLGLFLENFRTP